MPEFRYSAMDRNGKLREGSLTANTDHQVRQLLREQSLLPIQISSAPFAFLSHLKYTRALSSQALAEFCHQIAMVLKAGVTLTRGLELMRTQIPDRLMRQEADRMYREVQTGRSLSEVMSAADSRVPPLLARMVATGEASGRLEEILTRMAEFYEQEYNTQKKIQGAMVYPAILLFVSLGLIFFVFKFLIPQIQNLLKGTGAELPAITRKMLAFSALAQEYFLLFCVIIILVIAVVKFLLSTPKGRIYRDRFYTAFPTVGIVVQGVATTRFARTACIVFSSGLPLLALS
jgi:type IV pilus assembly protein PilC